MSESAPLALPAPTEAEETQKLEVGSTLRLDDLGPMVVNSDGTLSRIANWKAMTDAERERTLRVLGKRNQLRIAEEERKLQETGSAPQEDSKLTMAGPVVDDTRAAESPDS